MLGITSARLAVVLTLTACLGKAQAAAPETVKGEVVVGGIFSIKLPCNPSTGFEWEVKSIDSGVAVSTGTVEFQRGPAKRGKVGVGGNCILLIKGVKPGKTTAVLVYRRPWEEREPSQTATFEIEVLPLPKKKS